MYRIIDHTADVGIEVEAGSLREAFEEAAMGMFSIMLDVDKVEPRETRRVEVRGESLEDLLVSFLEELLFLFDTEQFVPGRVRILELDPENYRLVAELVGERADPGRHGIHLEVKAVTRHMLEVDPRGRVRVLFDI